MDYELGPAVAPAAMGMPYGTRFRYYVGRGNDLLFNGGDDYALEFINRYFGFDLRSVPTDTRSPSPLPRTPSLPRPCSSADDQRWGRRGSGYAAGGSDMEGQAVVDEEERVSGRER
eukprot:387727-Rhodomonas_salina.1